VHPLEDDLPPPRAGEDGAAEGIAQGAADDAASELAPEPGEWEVETRVMRAGAEHHGTRLDRAAAQWVPEFSRSYVQQLIADGHVRVDDQVVTTPSRRLKAAQRVEIRLVPTAQSLAFRAQPMALAVVFEDEHLMVVDKPAGLVVHPAAGHWSGTLLNGLLAHHAGAATLPRAGIVHRLDKDTSGLMVVGKTRQAVDALSRAIAQREVHRQYAALCHGVWPATLTQVDAPIARDPRSRVRMAIVAGGKPARTDVARVACRDQVSAVRCTLHTGRTHQIRVHLSAQRHPLLGDTLYGGKPALHMQRQALHAERLAFVHPLRGQAMAWCSALPPDMAQAWRWVVEGGDDPAG
jgi:23S rRNA pseudouridine1911/1915/1917 synthase